jgi:hypothetical protein
MKFCEKREVDDMLKTIIIIIIIGYIVKKIHYSYHDIIIIDDGKIYRFKKNKK